MNIMSVEASELKLKNFEDVINRQKSLIEDYHKFDELVINSQDLDLNSYLHQSLIKSKLWCIVEEFGEFSFAKSYLHKAEELIDSIHFALELMILLGFANLEDYIQQAYSNYNENRGFQLVNLFCHYTNAGNFLKNKSWKRTQMETDIVSFLDWMKKSFQLHFAFAFRFFKGKEKFIEMYDRKSLVNQFRIRSRY